MNASAEPGLILMSQPGLSQEQAAEIVRNHLEERYGNAGK